MGDRSSERGTPAPSVTGSSRRSANDAINALANHAGNDSLKVGKPDFFYGDRDKFDTWVNQLDMYFMFNPMSEPMKPIFATTFMRGRAQHWVKPFLRTYLDSNGTDNSGGIFASYVNLKGAMRRLFGQSNEVATATRVIQHLTQKTSTAEYAAKFQEYAQLTEWDDEALQVMYRRGLKENVKDELMRDGRAIETLGDLVKVTIDLDDKLYERSLERRYDSKVSGKAGYVPNHRPSHGQSNFKQKRDPDAMDYEFNATQKGRKSKGTGKRGGPKRGPQKGKLTCYGCGKEGHIARNCRSKNKVQRSEFNMTNDQPGQARSKEMTRLLDKLDKMNDDKAEAERFKNWAATNPANADCVVELEGIEETLEALIKTTRRSILIQHNKEALERTRPDLVRGEINVIQQATIPTQDEYVEQLTQVKDRLYDEIVAMTTQLDEMRETGLTGTRQGYQYQQLREAHDKKTKQWLDIVAQLRHAIGALRDQRYLQRQANASEASRQDMERSRRDMDLARQDREQRLAERITGNTPPPEYTDEDQMNYVMEMSREPRQFNMMQRRINREQEHESRLGHGSLHWRFCYDDSCTVHYSSKVDSGYWPQRPKNQREDTIPEHDEEIVDETCFDDADNGEPPVLTPSDTEAGDEDLQSLNGERQQEYSSEEEGSEEYTDSEDDPLNDTHELMEIRIDGPKFLTGLFTYIASRHEEVFPRVRGRRKVHPLLLDQMLDFIRLQYWAYPRVDVGHVFQSFVRERIPLGSQITPYGYLTPQGEVVTQEMRQALRRFTSQTYAAAQALQIPGMVPDNLEQEIRKANLLQTRRKILEWLEARHPDHQGKGSTLQG